MATYSLRAALIIAAIVIAIRAGLHYAGIHVEALEFVPVHLLAVVLVAFLSGHFLLRKDASRGMPDLIRNGMRDTALYAVLIAAFIYIFFTYINVTEFPQRNAMMIDGLVKDGHTREEAKKRVEQFYSPGGYASITFFGLLLLGVLNALLFAALHHKVLRRFRR